MSTSLALHRVVTEAMHVHVYAQNRSHILAEVLCMGPPGRLKHGLTDRDEHALKVRVPVNLLRASV
jgi:hypothetical protein